MVAARAIAGISLLFTFSVAAGLLLQDSVCAAPLCIILPGAMLLTALSMRRWKSPWMSFLLLIQLGVWISLNEGQLERLDPGPSRLERASEQLRAQYGRFVDGIPFEDAETGALIKALTAGDRSGLSRQTKQVFRSSGASHLLALSGLHLGILYAILQFLLGAAGRGRAGRIIRYAVLTGSSGAYCILTGASPSLVRAFLFIFLAETARLTGRKAPLLDCLCGALLLQLAFHPGALRMIGFQLSYLAVFGIALLYPPLKRLYPEGRPSPMRYLWNGAALSIACQCFTAPLVWLRFHQFPRYFLLTNLLALPLTTLLMVASVTTLALWGLGICPTILIQATETLVRSLINVLTLISGM